MSIQSRAVSARQDRAAAGLAPRCPHRMKRFEQVVLIVTFLGFCWLGFQAVHELGHAAGAWLSGGKVVKVVLHPCAISRTDVEPNPRPLVVVCVGPLDRNDSPSLGLSRRHTAADSRRLPLSLLCRLVPHRQRLLHRAWLDPSRRRRRRDARPRRRAMDVHFVRPGNCALGPVSLAPPRAILRTRAVQRKGQPICRRCFGGAVSCPRHAGTGVR